MSQQEVCVICQETPGENFVNLGCCKQKCCVTCFVKWMRIGNTCPTCRHVHAPKPEKPKPEIIRVVEREPVREYITSEMFQKAGQICWNNDLHLIRGLDKAAQNKAIELAKMMAVRVTNLANGVEE